MPDSSGGPGPSTPGPLVPGVLLLALEGEVQPTGELRFQVGPVPVFLRKDQLLGVVVGSASALARERQHFLDLWAWCLRNGVQPPPELAPRA